MEGILQFFTSSYVVVLLTCVNCIFADYEHMISTPEPITLAFGYETKLTCEMNIEPDKFKWKFYPTSEPYNPKAYIDLSDTKFVQIADHKFEQRSEKTRQRKKSALTIQANSTSKAGDYQCLAYYGANVVASVPWRITIARLNDFKFQENQTVTVTEGNTISWRCNPPESNPEAYIDYYKDNKHIDQPFSEPQITTLLLQNITHRNSGTYQCTATNTLKYTSKTVLNLNVVKYAPRIKPYFIINPKETYIAVKGETVFFDCAAIGNPVPNVIWYKKSGNLPEHRIEYITGGLKIKNVSSTDDGIYVCEYKNIMGSVTHQITLIYQEEPKIECLLNNTDVKQGDNLDLDCSVKGTPEPKISWFINGYSVVNDSNIEAIGNHIYIRPIEKRHAGNLQIFARNVVKTVYSHISIKVIPLTSSVDDAIPPRNSHRRHNKVRATKKPMKHRYKTPEMTPPNKPIITRLSDESVMVRWSVPQNDGLPILFFKVQYRELGPASSNEHHRGKGSRWKTTNADIAPNINNYEVEELKPDYIYKFRIAAVYSNNDNKLSNNSDKFHLRRLDFDDRNPLPVPIITHTETINASAVKIYWKYTPNNISIDGFYISYISSSSAENYLKATVDGKNTKSYIISHLQPDMHYDVKLQSFNSKAASEFSFIMKAKTAALPVTIQPTTPPTNPLPPMEETSTNMYIFIVIGVVVLSLIICSAILMFVCKKWKQNKNPDENKTGVEEHHIQADAGDYVVGPKTVQRSNGCGPNRITITANPLAESDNKTQNMIEMSCMTSQNNNCSLPAQPSVSELPNSSLRGRNKAKTREKLNKRVKNLQETELPNENYV